MYRKLINKKNNRGVSLAEMLIVVAILLILMAVAVPSVITIQKNLRQTELDAKAEMIYVAVQNKLSKMKAGGNTAVFQVQADNGNGVYQLADIPGDADSDVDNILAGDICYFTSSGLNVSGSAASFIMDQNTMDESLLNNHWVIEFNPKTSVVYAVFYSEDLADCAGEYVSEFNKYDWGLRFKINRLEDGARVGYYGGGSVAETSTASTLTPVLTIDNSEKLTANVVCTLPVTVTDSPVFKLEFEDTTGNKFIKYYAFWACSSEYMAKIKNEAGSWEVDASPGSMQRTGRTFTLSLILDDLSSQGSRFVNQYGKNSSHSVKLKSGTPLKITVTAMCPGNYKVTQNISDSKITNSLFADTHCKDPSSTDKNLILNTQYGNETNPATVHFARHLQNLDETSGVIETVQYVEQSSDITFAENASQADKEDWYETYSGKYFNGIVGNMPNFKPIYNRSLVSYNGVQETTAYRIMNLTEQTATNGGLFAELGNGQTLKNIILTGANVKSTGNNTAAGALVGKVSGNAKIEHCQVLLTPTDINGKTNRNVWISGNTAGGLVGVVASGNVEITDSAASTVVGEHHYDSNISAVTEFQTNSVGGLVGSVSTGANLNIIRSYADSYLFGYYAGGLVGEASVNVGISSCYTAGFITYATEGAGLVCGPASMKNSYTVIHRQDLQEMNLRYFATAKSGSTDGKVLFSAATANTTDNNLGESIGTLTIDGMVTALGTDFQSNTASSVPYNLMGQTLSTYSFPVLINVNHYGDWLADFQVGALVYYEMYSDGSYGFYGANVDSTLKNDSNLTVLGDGYGVVYRNGGANLPDTVSVTVTDQDNSVATDDLTISGVGSYPVNANGIEYSIYPISKTMVNTNRASARFYLKAEVRPNNASQSDFYYFNPHFAKTVVFLTDANASVPVLNSDSNVAIRTARHLYMLSEYYDNYASVTAPCTYQQERNIAYTSYDWAAFSLRNAGANTQSPIAGGETAFKAIYDGQCNWITDVSFTTETGLYVGLIGRNAGTIRNVVLRASYKDGRDDNYYVGRSGDIENNQSVYMGVLAGRNEDTGRISNCAVAGYYIAGSDGTIHAYQNSYLYAGGLVGTNYGNIQSCAADTPTLRLSSIYANVFLGGFTGNNVGIINNSYALGHIEVAFAKGGSVSIAGFAGRNSAIIRNSYCATALTASGEMTTAYGFAPAGGSVSSCKYLNNGTYSYINHMHSFNFDKGDGDSTLFGQMRVAVGSAQAAKNSYDFNNTQTVSKFYPFRAVVKDATGKLVHYGDWLDDENMGTLGIFYWEHEIEGSNNGYHFTYLGTVDGEAVGGTSLCNAHDDGGVISEYGYGYFELNKGSVKNLQVNGAKINGSSTFASTNGAYNEAASNALEEQMNLSLADGTRAQYYFYAFTTRTAEEAANAKNSTDNGNYVCLSGSEPNSTWTLNYESASGGVTSNKQFTFTVSPFFANAMSMEGGKTITATDGTGSDYSKIPGGEGNQYEVRSIEQLQFINWNTYKNSYTDVDSEQTESYFPYECATGTNQKFYSQTHDVTNKTNEDGTSRKFYALGRAGRSFKERYNGNSYQIKNIYIEMSTSPYVGLFGELGGGTVLENIIMYAEDGKGVINNQYSPYSGGNGYREPVVGALAGMVWVGDGQENQITIKNCSSAGYTVKYSGTIGSNVGFSRYISCGGLIGSLFSGKVENSCAANNVVVDYSGMAVRQQIGGLVGTAGKTEHNNNTRSTIINCYSGGTITPDKATGYIYLCGGLVGNANGKDQDNGLVGLEETKIQNCYTYCDVETSNVDTFKGYYYITTNIKTANNVENSYYLKNDSKIQATDYAVGTGYSYDQMSHVSFIEKLGGTSGTGNTSVKDEGYHRVTTTEGSNNVNIDGKYSYPNSPALEEKNYPFPAIIQQKDLTFSTVSSPKYVYVHYGDWPIEGPYWERGRDSMDIFQDMNLEGEYTGYATKKFYLNSNGTSLSGLTIDSFEYNSDIVKIVAIEKLSETRYAVTVQAVTAGITSVKLKGTDALFTLEVTANIQITSSPENLTLKVNESGNLEFEALSIIDAEHATAKSYKLSNNTSWVISVDSDKQSLVEWSMGGASKKNEWIVKRLGLGKLTLKVTFTYQYDNPDATKEPAKFTKDLYVNVLQPDTVGLSSGLQYHIAYLGDSRYTEIASYPDSERPKVPEKDFFLYLDSMQKELEKMEIKGIKVNNVEATFAKEGDKYVGNTTEGYHLEMSAVATRDEIYQYMSGAIYYLTDASLTDKENIPLEITVKDGPDTYTLSINLSKVTTQKSLEIKFVDSYSMEYRNPQNVLSGTYTLPTQAEILGKFPGFAVPYNKIITGWKVKNTTDNSLSDTTYAVGTNFDLVENTIFVAVYDDIRYTATLNANGGKISISGSPENSYALPISEWGVNLSAYSGTTIRTGYNLTGWKLSDEKTYGIYDNILIGELSGDITLEAQWEPKTYTVYLQPGEALTEGSYDLSIHVVFDSPSIDIIKYDEPKREGFKLIGWKNSNDERVITIDDDGSLKFVPGVSGYTDGSGNWIHDNDHESFKGEWIAGYKLKLYTTSSDPLIIPFVDYITDVSGKYDSSIVQTTTYGTFIGWFAKDDNGYYNKVFDSDGKNIGISVTQSMDLYAGWEKTVTKTLYEKISASPGLGINYLIVAGINGTTGYALTNDNSGGVSATEVTINDNGEIESPNVNCIWNYFRAGSGNNKKNTFSNQNGYLNLQNNSLSVSTVSNTDWSVGNSSIYNKDRGNFYYVTYTNGFFGIQNSSANVSFYKESTKNVLIYTYADSITASVINEESMEDPTLPLALEQDAIIPDDRENILPEEDDLPEEPAIEEQ